MDEVRSTCTNARKYRAFISYSHDDGEAAKWLHNALETWKLPSDIRALVREQQGDLLRLFPVFIDHGELSSSPSLRQALKQALDNSDALIVLCSPTSAASKWVNEEVLHFKRTRRGEKIITVMVESAPKSTNHALSSDEYFCPALRHPLGEDDELEVSLREEPLAIDMRERSGISRRDVLLKVIAGILGVDFDQLKRRERNRKRNWWIACSVVIFAALMLLAWSLYSKDQARRSRIESQSLELLSIADARFRRLDYDDASDSLQSSINLRQGLGQAPSLGQLALIYRTLLDKRVSMPFSEVTTKYDLQSLAQGSVFLVLLEGARVALINNADPSVLSYIDMAPVLEHFLQQGMSATDLQMALQGQSVEADTQGRKLYLLIKNQLFTFNMDSGELQDSRDLAQEGDFSSFPSSQRTDFELYWVGGQLIVEFGRESKSVAFRLPDGGWKVISDRSVSDWDDHTGDVYLNDLGRAIERYRDAQLQGRLPINVNRDFVLGTRNGLLSVIDISTAGTSVITLDTEKLKPLWRCHIVSGKVLQADPIAADQLLVQTESPAMLWLYRRDQQDCHVVGIYPSTATWFDYVPEWRQLVLAQSNGSEWVRVTDDGFERVAQLPYSRASVTPKGEGYAVHNEKLLKVWPQGQFFGETVKGTYRASGKTSMLFATTDGIRSIALGSDIAPDQRWVRSYGGKTYQLSNQRGEVLNELNPVIDGTTIGTILRRVSFDGDDGMGRLLAQDIRTHGSFWHSPILDNPWNGDIYGETFSVLTRINIKSNQFQVLPAPNGEHSINESTGEVWTRGSMDGHALTYMSPESQSAIEIEGSSAYFAAGAGESPWYRLRGESDLVFSEDGHNTLVFNTDGRWAIIDAHQLQPAVSPTTRDLAIKSAVFQAQGWLMTTRDDRLVRMSTDGTTLLQQAPLRPGASQIVDLSDQGLVLVQTSEGVALHDAVTLAEVALIPGYTEFHALGAGQQVLLAVSNSKGDEKWNIYRLPAFGNHLLERVDELRLTQKNPAPLSH
ncbi:toll/interleukin-1 receptor domain-containing protein [Pseudomonas nunensis]|uniref:toll/interleukin-1 receptor domain-containing protein n=1 Tax=Pseudomonas nunensis TaxID=2961896 RepID=UPI0025AF2884|nr:toll/interleukin-1 receptor domain-containing protein [Pseudomonas nunensis]MDN3221110.1 toll/interleukin-1 receptor domain-containing protein [Pseudomonas nunensis]